MVHFLDDTVHFLDTKLILTGATNGMRSNNDSSEHFDDYRGENRFGTSEDSAGVQLNIVDGKDCHMRLSFLKNWKLRKKASR